MAVNVFTAAVMDLTSKKAFPFTFVIPGAEPAGSGLVPLTAVITGLPEPDVLLIDTVLPETGLLFMSFNVTVIVEMAVRFAAMFAGLALTVD